jgi:hypothetical protein
MYSVKRDDSAIFDFNHAVYPVNSVQKSLQGSMKTFSIQRHTPRL